MKKEAGFADGLAGAYEALRRVSGGLESDLPRADELENLVALVRTVERSCTAVLVQLANAARTHSRNGLCAPPETLLQADGAVTSSHASRDVARARVSRTFPLVGVAVASSKAFGENLDILARTTDMMTEAEIEALKVSDSVLADAAGRLGAESFRKRVQRLRNKIRSDAGQTASQQAQAQTRASVSPSRDNLTYRLSAVFNALEGEAVSNAHRAEIRRLSRDLGTDHGYNPDELSAKALSTLIVRGSKTESTCENNTPHVSVGVLVDRDTLANGPHDASIAETTNGMPVSPGTVGRLCCDATIRRIDCSADANVHVSRSSRTATAAQRAALRALYESCPISGASWAHIEVHHVIFNEHGGDTILKNLVPISSRWHHLIHDQGWRLEMDADRTLRLYRPHGTLHKTIAPPVPVIYEQAA